MSNLFGKSWKLDVGSTIFAGNFQPDSENRAYEPVGSDGYKLTVKGVKNGTPYEWGYTARYDGKDHVVTGRDDVDSIEAYKVNDNITIGFFKKNAELRGSYQRQVSTDGQTLTVQAAGRGTDGKPYYDVLIYRL